VSRAFEHRRQRAHLEQAEILTTHNLAALWQALKSPPDPNALARLTFNAISLELSREPAAWKAQLRRSRRCASAWRQMVFFLSCPGADALAEFLLWARAQQPCAQLASWLDGLEKAGPPVLGWRSTKV
jgi:hypothetical protein